MNSKYQKLLIAFLYVLIMTTIVWLLNGQSIMGIDDANIYFIYMRNLADGHGFVYNIGGERVEGFTSLLWTLVGSFFYLISKTPQIFLLIFNVVIISFTFWKLIIYIDGKSSTYKVISPASLLMLGLVAVYPGYFEWAVLSLMETGLWSSLLILMTLNLLQYEVDENKNKLNNRFYYLLVLLVLCRPEAIVWGILFIGLRIYQYNTLDKDRKSILRNTAIVIGLFFSFQIILLIWRLNYFGYPLPNTYYAKISSDIMLNLKSGIGYLFRYLIDSPGALLSVIFGTFAIIKLKKEHQASGNQSVFYLFSVMIITFFIPLYTGGDHFNLSRFIQPTVPLLWLLLIISLIVLQSKVIKKTYIMLFLLFLLFTGETSWFKYKIEGERYLWHEWNITEIGSKQSIELNKFCDKMDKLPTQGVGIAGATAYYYHGFTYDLLGLNNTEMAHTQKNNRLHSIKGHMSFNKNIFLKQHPDLFFMGGGFIDKKHQEDFRGIIVADFFRNIFHDIMFDKDFRLQYSNVLIQRRDYSDALAVFASNRFLGTLDTNIYKVQIYPHYVEP